MFVAAGSLNAMNIYDSNNTNPTYELLDAEGGPDGKSIEMDILEKNQPY